MNSSKFSFISAHSVADIDGSVHSRSGPLFAIDGDNSWDATNPIGPVS